VANHKATVTQSQAVWFQAEYSNPELQIGLDTAIAGLAEPFGFKSYGARTGPDAGYREASVEVKLCSGEQVAPGASLGASAAQCHWSPSHVGDNFHPHTPTPTLLVPYLKT
jgi:hypothetical protein